MPLLLNTLIADDERFARERLVKLLEPFPLFRICRQAKNGDDVAEILKTEKIDVAFLDINMPGTSVFHTLEKLQVMPFIVFQTAYSEFAVKAFRINAVDYLLKPVDRALLSGTVQRIEKLAIQTVSLSRKAENIPLRIGNSIRLIPFSSLFFIHSRDGFSYLNTGTDDHISEKSLNYYQQILNEHQFFRTSRSSIVNLDKIERILQTTKSNYTLLLTNGSRVPLSRRSARELRKILNLK